MGAGVVGGFEEDLKSLNAENDSLGSRRELVSPPPMTAMQRHVEDVKSVRGQISKCRSVTQPTPIPLPRTVDRTSIPFDVIFGSRM